jgi:hypothetical protein
MPMKKIFFIFSVFLAFLVIPLVTKGQAGYEDAIYLKSGAIIYGTIIENVPNQYVTIKTEDGNVLSNKWSTIYKIAKVQATIRKKKDTVYSQKAGHMLSYSGIIELNGGICTENNVGSPAFGLHVINGVAFYKDISAGAGIGYNKCDTFSFIPIFVDLRINTFRSPYCPVFGLDIGSSTQITSNIYKMGGFMVNLILDEKIPLTTKKHLDIGLEFNHQRFTNYYKTDYISNIKLNVGIAVD